jgi:oligoendopeptidase F
MMVAQRWVEGTVGDTKRPGAYCMGFRKSRTPRVYMTYTGGASDVITLAHELGHAYHSWVMRDLPESQLTYGMALAETASTFGETLVRDAMLSSADSLQTRLDVVWEDMSALITFVLNIPSRFEFERNFYEAREERPLRPEELNALMSDAWQSWYGDALSEPDPMFWASKLHFFISGLSFYNFPYLFGYLFSLGVYASRDRFGDAFFDRYKALLRDTGRMTAETLATKHLDADLTKPEFWCETLEALAPRVDAFEAILEEAGFARGSN